MDWHLRVSNKISSRPPNIPAASLDLNGFQTLYSVFVAGGTSPFESAGVLLAFDSMEMRFSPYTDSPGVRFLVLHDPKSGSPLKLIERKAESGYSHQHIFFAPSHEDAGMSMRLLFEN